MQSVYVVEVVFFLKRDVDDGLGDFVSHFFKLFGFFDEDFEVIRKVHLIPIFF
jgi:hypothetical protein